MLYWMWMSSALANGQTTHMWISHEAVDVLPEGELRSFLQEPAHMAALENGTMFPDGGYAVGHPYGETAHWEPFQGLLRDWIIETYPDVSHPDAGEVIAFYLGLASHGMADQVFDALYMERSKQLDAEYGWANGQSLDVSSDIVWAWETGPQAPPEVWYPEVMVALFEEVGIEVDDATLRTGQERLGIAIDLVGATGQDEGGVKEQIAHFPWACSHMSDRTVPGGPYSEAEIIAQYWEALWAELQGEAPGLEVLASFPAQGGMAHERDVGLVESRLSVVFNRSLLKSDLADAGFGLVDEFGGTSELDAWLFYRDDSHVAHFSAMDDFEENTDYQFFLSSGLVATDGRSLQNDVVIDFSTRPFEDPTQADCSCASTNSRRLPTLGWVALLAGLVCVRRRDLG